jgi:4-amino-4-deoxy-L-arabinose transferase-like glycosyltransferase
VWLLLLLATCLLILSGALLPHLDGDDKFFGDIARRILVTGDWVNLQHPDRGTSWVVDKPPLSFWLMAISIKLGGDNAAALRFWQLLMAVVSIYVTVCIARLGAEREESLLAGVLLGTSALFFYLSFNPKQDVPLSLFTALAFYAYLIYRSEGKTTAAVLSGVWIALAVLSKGIVALPAFAPVILADLLIAWSAKRPAHWRWSQVIAGAAVFMLIALPWFIVGALHQGRPFIDTFFLTGTVGVGRFFDVARRGLPYWEAAGVMVAALLAGTVPWAGFLPGAMREAWRGLLDGPPSVRLCTLWAGFYFALVGLSPGYKLFHHILPMFVPVAVLTARAIMRTPSDPRRLRLSAGIALLTAVPVVAMIVLSRARYPEEARLYVPFMPALVLLLAALGAFAVFALSGRVRSAVAVACAVSLLAYGWAELTMVVKFRDFQVPQGQIEEPFLISRLETASGFRTRNTFESSKKVCCITRVETSKAEKRPVRVNCKARMCLVMQWAEAD